MSSRKLQKEIENTFKKINEGLDSFNYHYDRIQDLNNQVLDRNLESQKDKLENDLKREIKKLQKHRESIKNWQSNESIDSIIDRSKLNEYRKLVEYAMEKYKEVEKNSKMKTFSNQSIMMASLETNNLSPLAIEMIEFLEVSKDQLNEQIESLEAEYEKISSKRSKKNSSNESEKAEIENYLSVDRFHVENFDSVIDHLKSNQIDPELVEKIKDDITFIIESNQDPDFINDDTLYDEINQQAESNFKYKPKESTIEETLITPVTGPSATPSESTSNIPAANNITGSISSLSTTEQKDNTTPGSSSKLNIANNNGSSIPVTKKSKSPSPSTPKKLDKIEVSSPDIVHKLKPASTPAKVGEIAWSSIAAAASASTSAAAQSTSSSNVSSASPTQVASGAPLTSSVSAPTSSSNQEDTPTKVPVSAPNVNTNAVDGSSVTNQNNQKSSEGNSSSSKFASVFANSNITPVESNIFNDSSIVKLPPGMQHLILSFTATTGSHTLLKSPKCDSLCGTTLSAPIVKPFLPKSVQIGYYNYEALKLRNSIDLSTYSWSWNALRSSGDFDSIINTIKSFSSQLTSTSNWKQVNDLTSILFYGFYYGITPTENLLAEQYLFDLGWRPYNTKVASDKYNAERFEYWFKVVGDSDYQVFELSSWDYQVKFSIKLDHNLIEMNGIKFIA